MKIVIFNERDFNKEDSVNPQLILDMYSLF